jgi:triosephosphate isomerase
LKKSGRPPFVAGNWKMHLTLAEARALAVKVVEASGELSGATCVLIPPYTALDTVGEAVAGTPVGLGAQNLHWEDKGAFTGEVSAPMLADAGCCYVVIGHSERRQFFGETDETVNRKVGAALRHLLTPILCVGETLEIRDAGRALAHVGHQIDAALAGIGPEAARSVIIAYEPVWAIGTGRTASPGQAEEVHAFLRKKLSEKYGDRLADCAIILYGGSVKPANAWSLFREQDIDGFLVGGASLEADSFIGIVREALRAQREDT